MGGAIYGKAIALGRTSVYGRRLLSRVARACSAMKFALVLLSICSGHHCDVPRTETKLYPSYHACWVHLVPKIYYSARSSENWKCVPRADFAVAKSPLSKMALPPDSAEIEPLLRMESGGNAQLLNQFGYAGLFQFGAPLLIDLGLYTPGPSEDLSNWSKTGRTAAGKWTGMFSIPGFPTVRKLSDFLENRAAQFAAFTIHQAAMQEQIAIRGLDGYVDHEIAGTPITRTGLLYMIHLGGVGGAQRVLRTQGRANPRDANGTSLLDYARLGASRTRRADQKEVVAAP
jgi:hypothetical protein